MMKIKSEKNLKLRECVIKNLPHYSQSQELTCGAAASLIVLNHFFGNKFPLNSRTERKISHRIKSEKCEYGNFCKIAALLASYGLDAKLVFYGPNLKHPIFKKALFKALLKEYLSELKKLSKEKKVKVVNKNFNIFDIMSDLSGGYLVIVEISYPDEELTHILLLRGFRGRKILYIDPTVKNGGRSCYYKALEKRTNLKSLKNYIAVRKIE